MKKGFSSERLLRDFQYIQRNVVEGVSCHPLDEDLHEWHGNVVVNNYALHFVMKFSSFYPQEAPSVRFVGCVPRERVGVRGDGVVCSEMLGNGDWAHDNFVEEAGGWNGWSSAYGPHAVMLQLLLMVQKDEDDEVERQRALQVKCAKCGHAGHEMHTWRPVSSENAMQENAFFTPLPRLKIVLPKEQAPKKAAAVVVVAAAPVVNQNNVAMEVKKQQQQQPAAVAKPQQKKVVAKSEWVEVGGRKRRNREEKPKTTTTKKTTGKTMTMMQKTFGMGAVKQQPQQQKAKVAAVVKKEPVKEFVPVGWVSDEEIEKEEKRLAAVKKENERLMKLEQEAKKQALLLEKKQKQGVKPTTTVKAKKEVVVDTKKEEHDRQMQHKLELERQKLLQAQLAKPAVASKKSAKKQSKTNDARDAMGAFSVLSHDVLNYLLGFLSIKDVLRCASLCREFYRAATGAFLWRDMFMREFPSSMPKNMVDFRHAYMLRIQGIVSELHCFHTKQSLHDDDAYDMVLGYGLTYTTNPKTQMVDYIDCAPDFVSATAFQKLNVRRGARGEQLQAFLPLYFTEEHFERAIPSLKKCCSTLYPQYPFEEAIVRTICAALNTRAVLLADKGVPSSVAAFTVYCQLHRLFIACCEEFPRVQSYVDDAVRRFMRSEQDREKSSCPSLGDFLPLLLVTRVASWPQVKPLFLKEMLARNVLWAARSSPVLANLQATISAEERCRLFWSGTVVSNRLVMLSALMLSMSRRSSSPSQTARHLDRLYGSPSPKDFASFRRGVERILSPDADWSLFFRVVCGTEVPPQKRMDAILRDAVRDSRYKGYHNERTNFSAVQASGVSKILRKGESYTTARDVDGIMLSLGWSFKNGVIYLDASMLCYDIQGNRLPGTIDYMSPVCPLLGDSAMHSGDQIRGQTGEHNIRVNLRSIPSKVHMLALVLSAWTHDLSSIHDPFVRLVDERHPDQELCSYSLEKAGSSQAVYMAKLVRQLAGWKVIPVGVTSPGTVRDYAPIEQTIRNVERTGRSAEE